MEIERPSCSLVSWTSFHQDAGLRVGCQAPWFDGCISLVVSNRTLSSQSEWFLGLDRRDGTYCVQFCIHNLQCGSCPDLGIFVGFTRTSTFSVLSYLQGGKMMGLEFVETGRRCCTLTFASWRNFSPPAGKTC